MSAISTVHEANAQVLAQIRQLAEVATAAQRATTVQYVHFAELNASDHIQKISESAKQAALDTVV